MKGVSSSMLSAIRWRYAPRMCSRTCGIGQSQCQKTSTCNEKSSRLWAGQWSRKRVAQTWASAYSRGRAGSPDQAAAKRRADLRYWGSRLRRLCKIIENLAVEPVGVNHNQSK